MFKIVTMILILTSMLLANKLLLKIENEYSGYIIDDKVKINKNPINMGVVSSYDLSNDINFFGTQYENVLTQYTTGSEPNECSIPIFYENNEYKYNTCICQSLSIDVKAGNRFYELSVSKFIPKLLADINDDIFYNVCSNHKIYHPTYSKTEKKFIIKANSITCEELSDNDDQSNLNFDLSKCINSTKNNTKTIQIVKQPLYSAPSIKTKMYLIKGDNVEILEEQTDKQGIKWLHILYHAKKKDIKAWIPKSAVDTNTTK